MKDINYYRKELQELQSKYKSIEADPSTCSHVLNKQAEVIKETEAMLPDSEARLEAAKVDLQEFLSGHADDENVTTSTVYAEAQTLLVQ